MKRLCLIGLILAFIVSCKDDDDQIIAQCEIPTNLLVSSITDVSASLSWENSNDSQNVNIEYGISGWANKAGYRTPHNRCCKYRYVHNNHQGH